MAAIRPEVTGRRSGETAVEAERSDGPPYGPDEEEVEEEVAASDGDEAAPSKDSEELEPSPLEGAAARPRRARPLARAPPTFALTMPEFCVSHNISEAFYYMLQKDGRGPRTMRVGRRRLISVEEARRWREERTSQLEKESRPSQ
jgi:hypothetical protein